MNNGMTQAQNKLYNILLNLFKNKDSTFPKDRGGLKQNHRFFEIILDELQDSNQWYGRNTIINRIVGLIKEKKRNDLLNIICTSVLDTLGDDCSLRKIEYKRLLDCCDEKGQKYEQRYRTKEEVTIEKNPKADDIIKNAIKRLFINILINPRSDTLFQSTAGTYYLKEDSDIHYFQDEINVDNFKKVIATFDGYIFQNEEIKNLIETWADELEKVLKNDRKTLENKQKTNKDMGKQSNGANSFDAFLYDENNKGEEVKKEVKTKQNNSKGNNNLTMVDLFKRAKKNKKMKTEEGNSGNKGSYFKDSKEEEEKDVKDVKMKDNFDEVRNRTNERKKQSNSKKEESNIDSNNKNNNKEEKNVVLEGMGYKPAINHNNNCDCLTSFKGIFNKCF